MFEDGEHDGTCVICGERTVSIAGNPSRWPVRLGNDGWRHVSCVNRLLHERELLLVVMQATKEWRDLMTSARPTTAAIDAMLVPAAGRRLDRAIEAHESYIAQKKD